MWRKTWDFTKEVFAEWREDNALQWGAALAYYTAFSLAPVLVISIGVAALLFDRAAVQARVLDQLAALVGPEGARFVETMLRNAAVEGGGVLATMLGVGALLVGATTAFAQLKVALNQMWDVGQQPRQGWLAFLKKRVLALGLVLVVGFLLLVSMVASAALALLDERLRALHPQMDVLLHLVALVVSVVLVTVLFALLFRSLPDVHVAWRDVWMGAGVTAVLFAIGEHAIGLYLGNGAVTSRFGAAGALVAILVWVYYAAQVLFIGAEFTQVYARRFGSRVPEDALPR